MCLSWIEHTLRAVDLLDLLGRGGPGPRAGTHEPRSTSCGSAVAFHQLLADFDVIAVREQPLVAVVEPELQALGEILS